MAGQLEGRVALVTGGGSGIGRATSMTFAREGAKVAIADVNVEEGERTAHMVEEAGGEAMFVKTDVSRADEVEALIGSIISAHGRIDCAFNNAGVEEALALTHKRTEDEWDRIININLKGVWLCMKYEIPRMLQQGKGTIVNTSSAAGLIGIAGSGPYTASKHGVIGLTKSAALEYAKKGIRVNAVCPGAIRTPMVERGIARYPDMEKNFFALKPIGRLGAPEEIAESVVWLSSDAASFVTGHAMSVDGGWVAQ